MNILGLHFGHDGGVSVLCDGVLRATVLTERISRRKHAVSLTGDIVAMALKDAGIEAKDVDYCAATTTQGYPMLFDADDLQVFFTRHHKDQVRSVVEEASGGDIESMQLKEDFQERGIQRRLAPWQAVTGKASGSASAVYAPENMMRAKLVEDRRTIGDIARGGFAQHLAENTLRHAYHYPLTLHYRGRAIPGAFIDHHAAHGAGAYYQSGMRSAAVLTFDGALAASMSSLAFIGRGEALYPVAVPGLWLGWFYSIVGDRVGGLDAGKLMGLAPYGKPAFTPPGFLGSAWELGAINGGTIAEAWIAEALKIADAAGYDRSPLGDRMRILEKINVDMAASAHHVFEENVVAFAKALRLGVEASGLTVEGICLSGGCALSCPTNTRIANETGFERVFVEPACDDSGQSAGAALWAYHNLFGRPLIPRDPAYPVSPYLGMAHGKDARTAALAAANGARIEDFGRGAATRAAEDLTAGRVIGWYEGRSEIGPRALGHRSILADPRPAENWPRVNRIKGREAWRPFAPAVLAEDATTWFKGMPAISPYMLFTGDVVDRGALPAIAHVDGTARVQTVTAACGNFCDVLKEARSLTGCSVVMNTSLNGPREPIVETPADAVRFLLASDLDALYVDGVRIAKT